MNPIQVLAVAQVAGGKNILVHSVPTHGQKLIQLRWREKIGSYGAVVGNHKEVYLEFIDYTLIWINQYLKLLRRTRKSMINDGKFKNYLFYALGEIILVRWTF